ncbi:Uncharacterized protein BP5553_09926 [Venustampulla echinocandica]|uniref:S-adenosyl-L-methionine-dependent methyltransferase n=1 Tax=Venustampulla echinocandica TaxID=2656787 RepID=A0A370TB29_9HELO|nr:Uncharacterized protein BP5553_09926 [Venustampulla echinocandica]RDL31137.1 Uncharacterized protein BP5553_09926 [Venustampulla echinocandica]
MAGNGSTAAAAAAPTATTATPAARKSTSPPAAAPHAARRATPPESSYQAAALESQSQSQSQSISPTTSIQEQQMSGPEEDIPVDSAYEQDEGDGDSAYDAGSTQTDTTSLLSDITKYRYENNRRYHAYKDGEYWGPNDEKQNNQLDIAHHMYLLMLGGKLHLAPIREDPHNVLDVGTGTGIWAIDFADQYPSSQVIGFDLSPIQPSWLPPNVRFEINDACADWDYKKNSFDFIHVRTMYGSVADWPAFYQQALAHLAPGQWYQQIEMSVVPVSDDGTIYEGHIFDQWGKISLEAGDKFGKDLRIHEQVKGYLEEAGFEDVVDRAFKMPIGPWSKDPHLKQIGLWNQLHWQEGIEGWSMALLTRVLGWSYTEVQAYLGKMREALVDRRIHAYHVINVVYGRKPMTQDG